MADWIGAEVEAACVLPWQEFQVQYPERSYRAWQTKRYRMRYVNRKELPTSEDLAAYFTKLEEVSALADRLETAQTELTLRLTDDRPVAIAFTGDWHCGARGVNYKHLRQDLNLLGADGVYLVGMGDFKHNLKHSLKQGSGLYRGVFNSPDEQLQYVQARLEACRGRWIALVEGNHEYWDYKTAGLHSFDALCEWLDCANLGHGGVLHIELGTQRYALGVRHKYKGSSSLNTTNSQRRFYDEYPSGENLDAVVLAHLHYNDLQKRSRRGHKTIFLRSGSYLVQDDYASEVGGYVGEPGVPLLILRPDIHRLIPFEGSDLEEGLLLLETLRR